MSCKDGEFILVCGLTPAGVAQTLREVTLFNSNGTPQAVYYYDPANLAVPLNTTEWVITPGECRLKERLLCVKLSNGTQWETIERIVEQHPTANPTYWEPAASPMTTMLNIAGNIASTNPGECSCACTAFS